MKIIYPFIGDSVGGNHISTLNLARNMKLLGHEVLIILHKKGMLSDLLDKRKLPYIIEEIKGYEQYRPELFVNIKNFLTSFRQIKRICKRHQPNIVHCNDFRTNLLWCFPLVGNPRVAFIWHQRSIAQKKPFFWSVIITLSFKYLAISKAAIAHLPSYLKNHVQIIYNPVSIEDISNNKTKSGQISRRQQRQWSQPILIGYVGRLVEWKHPEQLIDIVEILINKYNIQVNCILAGAGPEHFVEGLKQKIINTNLVERFELLGFQSNPARIYEKLDILICPSNPEPFGRTLVEAMLLGLPTVASACAGHLEIITDRTTGLLAKPNDPDDFAKKIIELIKDEEFRFQITLNAQEKATTFSDEVHAELIQAVYFTTKK